MGVDVSKIASSALEAALDDGQPRRKRGSTVKAVAAGAALAVAARAAASKAPRVNPLRLMPLPSLDGLRDIPDRVRDRLADAGWLDDEVDVEEPELDEEEPVDEAGLDEEPLDEEEEPEAEDEDEEPVDEAEEDEDEEDDEDELDDEEELEDELDEEDEEDEEQPELELTSEDEEDLHPEDRPPKPPRSKAGSRR